MKIFVPELTRFQRCRTPFTLIKLLAVPAVAGGHLWPARKQVRKAFTLIELLVVIAMIAILYAIVMPALLTARQKSKEASCLNNERAQSISVFMFAGDNEGKIKPDFRNSAVLNIDFVYQQYLDDVKIFECPETNNDSYYVTVKDVTGLCDYAVFSPFCYADAFKLDKCENPSSYRLIGEALPFPISYSWFDKDICKWNMSARWRHFRKMNVIFMDGGGFLEEIFNSTVPEPPYTK